MQTMVPRIRLFEWLALIFAVCAIVLAGGGALAAVSDRILIVISLDGTTPADVRSAGMPTLEALVRRGAAAENVVPVFPTNTFPNHVSLVTGVSPAVHGIVNNVFLDPKRGLFRYENDPSWIEVEPIWAIADRHGVVSAAYHWVGSEGPWRNGHGPRYWKPFDGGTPEREKVEQILAWLDTPSADDRPRLITSWFRGADRTGHRYGPGSSEAHDALRHQDRALALLVEGLDRRGAFDTAILLVVSDHGMAPVTRSVELKPALSAVGIEARVFGGGGFVTLSVAGGEREVARAAQVIRALGLEPHRPGEAPPGFSTANPRFGDVLALAPIGTAISGGPGPTPRGSHGYLPGDPGMGALLIAVGGGIPPGSRLGEVRNLDVAPTLLAWLGIPPPEWMEGRPIAGLVAGEPAPRSPVDSQSGEKR